MPPDNQINRVSGFNRLLLATKVIYSHFLEVFRSLDIGHSSSSVVKHRFTDYSNPSEEPYGTRLRLSPAVLVLPVGADSGLLRAKI